MIGKLAHFIDNQLNKIKSRAMRYRLHQYPNIHASVEMGNNVKLIGPTSGFMIGKNTYINDAILATGEKATIKIGQRCAVGYRVSIKASTHDVDDPCADENGHIKVIEKSIRIGNQCWIGDNVYIREGVELGNNVVVGANSVVTKSFGDDVVVAGVPAKVIAKRPS